MNGRVKSSKHKEMDALHKKSIRNHSYFLQPGLAGCFYCLKIFDVSAVQAWVDKGETALCPFCHVDSVLVESSLAFPLNIGILEEARKFYMNLECKEKEEEENLYEGLTAAKEIMNVSSTPNYAHQCEDKSSHKIKQKLDDYFNKNLKSKNLMARLFDRSRREIVSANDTLYKEAKDWSKTSPVLKESWESWNRDACRALNKKDVRFFIDCAQQLFEYQSPYSQYQVL